MSATLTATTAVVTLANHSTLSSEKPRFPPFSSNLFTRKLARFSRYHAPQKRTSQYYHLTGVKFRRSFSPVMEWQDCTVKMEVGVPISVAYNCYSDREAIPQWMPFISSVKILEDKPDLSRWSLKYKAFGRDIEFSWLARNMQPIKNQKIHWRSLEGLPNRGAVRFFPKGAAACMVELTVSYEVPQLLTPVASALQPFLESLLVRGLERFAKFAKTYSAESTT
ncbi:uncharacterized 17.2 kDa protein in melc2-rnhh intergenic region [Phtheirospermum japonicum]|uniref:Uncharacterized 17.2 kDa protein in melc2-rnhh intergenic region n=1 Tax=Phtheirospermum japonicum TaxID=374723 RepID=A0A830CB52_9LAMI|nr:uncharacterized 17.2 kDa protein in melc2-rnhh intergenic region [Phtheirospermum japonicum]